MNKKQLNQDSVDLTADRKSKNKKFENKLTHNIDGSCFVSSSYSNFKDKILSIYNENKLDGLRFDDCYFSIMGNSWLIDKYIARYGITDENSPENSIPAIKKAVEQNYAILISVQMTSDGELVSFKHKTLGSLTKESGYISNLCLAEIKKLTLLKTNEKIPTIAECLDIVAGRVPVVFEVFNENSIGKMEETLAKILCEYVEKYDAWNKVAILSMNPYSLEWFYKNTPWYTRILKSCSFKNLKVYANMKASKLKKLKYYKLAHADFICYNSIDLPCKYIKKCKPIGVIAYNVTSQAEYQRILPFADNIIFTDFTPTL